MFACRFVVVKSCSIPCDNPLQQSLSFFTVSLQKLHASLHVCLFVLIYKLLWHPSSKNFLTHEVLTEYTDPQLMSALSAIVTVIHLSS